MKASQGWTLCKILIDLSERKFTCVKSPQSFYKICCSIKIIKSKQATGLLGHLLQNQVHDIPFINFSYWNQKKIMNSLQPPTHHDIAVA